MDPVNVTMSRYETVSINCKAQGLKPFNYSWTKNGVKLSCVTSTLTIRGLYSEDTRKYCCTVTNKGGSTEGYTTVTITGKLLWL